MGHVHVFNSHGRILHFPEADANPKEGDNVLFKQTFPKMQGKRRKLGPEGTITRSKIVYVIRHCLYGSEVRPDQQKSRPHSQYQTKVGIF